MSLHFTSLLNYFLITRPGCLSLSAGLLLVLCGFAVSEVFLCLGHFCCGQCHPTAEEV